MVRNKEMGEIMRQESQQKILQAARTIFASRGFFNCKVSDIAQEAEMSQGNVYYYYSSKEDILKAVLQDGFQSLEDAFMAAEAFPGDGRQKIDHLLDQFICFCREQSDFMFIFLSLLGHGGLTFLSQMGFNTLEMGAGFHQHVNAIFSQADSEGILLVQDLNQIAVFFFSFFNGLMITYSQDWEELVPEEQLRQGIYRLLGIQSN